MKAGSKDRLQLDNDEHTFENKLQFRYIHMQRRGGYYEIPFTFRKITLQIFNKKPQNHDEYKV